MPFTLLSFVLVLTVVVFVHELGHFYIARRNGVRCQAFSIGFGPELFGYTDKLGTRWKFSLIPLGGYVKMFGEAETMQAMEGGSEEPTARELTPEEKAVSFKHKSIGQRAAIVFAGPAINFLFAVLVFWIMFMTIGRPVTEPIIGQVVEGSAAAEAGLLIQDRVKSIDGRAIARFEDIRGIVPLSDGGPMTLVIDRDGRELSLSITPRMSDEADGLGNPQKRYILGISASGESSRAVILNPLDAFTTSVGQTYEMVEGTLIAMGQMIAGTRGTEDMGGPVRIAQYSGQAAKTGFVGFMAFVAILSINLGLINLFPVPMLDGGHLLFYAIEAVRGRPLSERAQEWGLRVGLALVGALMIFVTWNDIAHL
ncbi:MAG: RIP metalloprotease RseP [Rhodospirillaceae bacterium]|nr:RIP metalloprotease RseP [Rhodospirillaceae bacterium]